MKLIKAFYLIVFLCSHLLVSAHYDYKSTINDIEDADFYKLELNSKVISHLRPDYYDLKIIDTSKTPLPYILQSNKKDKSALHGYVTEINHNQKISKYSFIFAEAQFFSGLSIDYGNNLFFHRNAKIKYLNLQDSAFYNIHEFEINSTKNEIVSFEKVKSTTLILEVTNGDNPPIKFTEFEIYSPKITLTALFSPNKSYSLLFGNEKAEKPNYDLIHFKKQIPKDIREVTIGSINKMDKTETQTLSGNQNQSKIIWGILGVIIVITSLITFKVLREIK